MEIFHMGFAMITKQKQPVTIAHGFNRGLNWFLRSGLMVSTIYPGFLLDLIWFIGKPLKWLCGGRLGFTNPRLKPWAMVGGIFHGDPQRALNKG